MCIRIYLQFCFCGFLSLTSGPFSRVSMDPIGPSTLINVARSSTSKDMRFTTCTVAFLWRQRWACVDDVEHMSMFYFAYDFVSKHVWHYKCDIRRPCKQAICVQCSNLYSTHAMYLCCTSFNKWPRASCSTLLGTKETYAYAGIAQCININLWLTHEQAVIGLEILENGSSSTRLAL
jgi:hypothetical protein